MLIQRIGGRTSGPTGPCDYPHARAPSQYMEIRVGGWGLLGRRGKSQPGHGHMDMSY